jgi:hypothetical protein
MCQNPVLACYRDQIGCDAHYKKIKERNQSLERNIITLCIGLNKFESYPTSRKIVERIVTILSLGIKHSYGLRELILRKMVVTDDDIDTSFTSILYLFICLDTTVKRDDELAKWFVEEVFPNLRESKKIEILINNTDLGVG